MIYALDTNALIGLQKLNKVVQKRYDAALRQGDIVVVASVVRFEARIELANPLYQRRLERLDALLDRHATLDLGAQAVDIAVGIYEALRPEGTLIDTADLLIAATVMRHGATLVTHNTKHFNRIPGLLVTDWQQENP